MPAPFRFKSLLRWTHRWIGLTFGLVFAVVSLSGSLLLFQPQLFRWAHGEMIPAGLPQQRGSIDQWVVSAHTAVPTLHGPIAIWGPHTDHNVSDAGMLIFTGLPPGGLGKLGLAAVLVAPTTGKVLGVVDVDRSVAYAPLFLHGALWSGDSGRLIIGIMAVGTLIMLPIGLYLWWPPRARLLQKLSPRPWRNTLLYAGRLHDVTGAWTVLLLFTLTATGLYIVQPQWVKPALLALPGADAGGEHRVAAQCSGPMGFDSAISRASVLVPTGTFTAMHPLDEQALHRWEVVFKPLKSDPRARETHVMADLECGTVQLKTTPASRSPRDAAELWIESVHDGTAFGFGGRLLVTLTGVMPLVLVWSGVRTWLRKRRMLPTKQRQPNHRRTL